MNYFENIIVFVGIITTSLSIISILYSKRHKKNDSTEYLSTSNNRLFSIDTSLREYSKGSDKIYNERYFEDVLTKSELSIIDSSNKNDITPNK